MRAWHRVVLRSAAFALAPLWRPAGRSASSSGRAARSGDRVTGVRRQGPSTRSRCSRKQPPGARTAVRNVGDCVGYQTFSCSALAAVIKRSSNATKLASSSSSSWR